jgi:hypothetical protein
LHSSRTDNGPWTSSTDTRSHLTEHDQVVPSGAFRAALVGSMATVSETVYPRFHEQPAGSTILQGSSPHDDSSPYPLALHLFKIHALRPMRFLLRSFSKHPHYFGVPSRPCQLSRCTTQHDLRSVLRLTNTSRRYQRGNGIYSYTSRNTSVPTLLRTSINGRRIEDDDDYLPVLFLIHRLTKRAPCERCIRFQ